MKKATLILLSVILAATLLAACSSADYAPGSSGSARNQADQHTVLGLIQDSAGGGYVYSEADDSVYYEPVPEAAPAIEADYFEYHARTEELGAEMSTAASQISYTEKIIYSCYAYIETLNFEETLVNVGELINAHGAFIESSSIEGSDFEASYRGWPRYRSANYTIRVPVSQLSTVTSKLDSLGHVVRQSSNAQNITTQFMDTESRLNSLRVQEERLLDMLKKAEDVPDLITIEAHLSDVRYQIEQLTTTLNHWQHQVDYSTLTLNISEVEYYQETAPVNRTYWERMGDGIMSSLRSVGRFFTELFMWLVVNAPVLILITAIGFAAFFIIRSKMRKAKAKTEERRKNSPPPYQPYNQQDYYRQGTLHQNQQPVPPQAASEDQPSNPPEAQ